MVLNHERKGGLKEPLFLTADSPGASQGENEGISLRKRSPLQFAMPYAKNVLLIRI